MTAANRGRITWLGHAAVLVRTAAGKTLIIDPWLEGNPLCPPEHRTPAVDAILITHGHPDHLGDTLKLAGRARPEAIVGTWELSEWLTGPGVAAAVGMNKGGTVEVAGARVTMVHAVHSCGIQVGRDMVYGGEAAGYIVETGDDFTVYHAGDTALFGDMQLIGEMYEPDLALLPIGGHYTMGPREAARACRLLGVSQVVPIHYGTRPVLTGTPDELRAALEVESPRCQVLALRPGESI